MTTQLPNDGFDRCCGTLIVTRCTEYMGVRAVGHEVRCSVCGDHLFTLAPLGVLMTEWNKRKRDQV